MKKQKVFRVQKSVYGRGKWAKLSLPLVPQSTSDKMNLAEHYRHLYEEAIQKIRNDEYQIDNQINLSADHRYGLTLLIRPERELKHRIESFLNELKAVEPGQYYYPLADIHVTALSIISCYEGFDLSKVCLQNYIELIKKDLEGRQPFEIQFKGITASPSCVMVQGFVNDSTLSEIRNDLRSSFRRSILQQTIDQRYTLQTAHATVVRFRKSFTQKDAFLKMVEKYREFDFGSSYVNSLELVYNDWYQRSSKVKLLHQFYL